MTAQSHRDLSSPIVRTPPGALSSEILLAAMHSAQRLERTCSRKLQQQARDSAVPDQSLHGWPGKNDAQRGPLRHFASKGLGFRVPLAPLSALVRGTFASPRSPQRAQVQQQSTATMAGLVMLDISRVTTMARVRLRRIRDQDSRFRCQQDLGRATGRCHHEGHRRSPRGRWRRRGARSGCRGRAACPT
jgi:hypothetical protein